MLHIYNTLTRKKEPFQPLVDQQVRLYVCGNTVYDYCHLGHASTMVAFDVVARYLRARGYELTYVRNITDIDDKIIQRAAEHQESVGSLTDRMITAMHEDAAALSIKPPDLEPRATECIDSMITMIKTLLDKGYAYAPGNGDVYYRVRQFAGYGQLSGKVLAELEAGARIAIDTQKEDPLDFVLWKPTKPGEPYWDSPWGQGRPGWHIECSAMCKQCLGDTFDIHGGGPDLPFPHHDNEIAQSEAANGQPFARYWMHTGALKMGNDKMSKSLGNFLTIREVLTRHPPETLRYLLISSHYRSSTCYSASHLQQAGSRLKRLYRALQGLKLAGLTTPTDTVFEQRFFQAMDDDFNTPEALAVLFDLTRELNRVRHTNERQASYLAAVLVKLGGILGILQDQPDAFLKASSHADSHWIKAMIEQRVQAKKDRDFTKADQIRAALAEQGVTLQDSRTGTTWYIDC